MRKLKYVRHHYGFVIFDEIVQHNDIRVDDIVSAGFCSISSASEELSASCWGESVSLNLKSRDDDSEAMTKFLNKENYF